METPKPICPRCKHSYTVEGGRVHVSWPHERWTFCGDTACVQAHGAAIAEAQSQPGLADLEALRSGSPVPPPPDWTSDNTNPRPVPSPATVDVGEAPSGEERVTVYDGKYTVVWGGDKPLRALRYGEEWRDCVGDGLVLALAQEVRSLASALETSEKKNDALCTLVFDTANRLQACANDKRAAEALAREAGEALAAIQNYTGVGSRSFGMVQIASAALAKLRDKGVA